MLWLKLIHFTEGGGGGGALEGEYHQPHTDHSSFQIIGFVE